MEQSRPQTLNEALQVLNEAMIAEGASLKELISADYSNMRMAIEDLAPRLTGELKAKVAPYVDKAREVAGPQIDMAVAGSRAAAEGFDKQLKKNPYLVLGGVALGAIALGYLVGRPKATPASAQADVTGLSYGDVPPATATNVELA